MSEWVALEDAAPEVGQKVRYYFDLLGEFDGEYHGKEDGLYCFGGPCGFLSGDVTHWKPRD